jgi:hypothetical protein
MKISKIQILAVSAAILTFLSTSHSFAGTELNLTESTPDLTGSYMTVTYSNTTDAFLASGYTTDYNTSAGDVGINTYDNFNISATINNSGVLTGGTLSIYGGEGASGPDELLLAGNLTLGPAGTAFGYGADNNQVFEFLFTVTGGQDSSVLSQFGGIGAKGGIVLNAEFGSADRPFSGTWGGISIISLPKMGS